jgi:hypothetical protein
MPVLSIRKELHPDNTTTRTWLTSNGQTIHDKVFQEEKIKILNS